MKVLLIGDLRTEHNWGAIATSTMLRNFLLENCGEVESIGHKNFVYNKDDYLNYVARPTATLATKLKFNARIAASKLIGRKAFPSPTQSKKSIHHFYSPEDDLVPVKEEDFDRYLGSFEENFPEEHEKINRSEVIVINAEGTIVNDLPNMPSYRRPGRYSLFMAYAAKKKYKKPTLLINFTYDPQNSEVDKIALTVMPLLDVVSVREPLSFKYLSSLGLKVDMCPDALFLISGLNRYKRIESKYILFGDSSSLKYGAERFFNTMSQLVEKCPVRDKKPVYVDGNTPFQRQIYDLTARNGLDWYSPRNMSFLTLYDRMVASALYFSGRWHNSIMALSAGTPVILFGADSYKTQSLTELYDENFTYIDFKSFESYSEFDWEAQLEKIYQMDRSRIHEQSVVHGNTVESSLKSWLKNF